MSFYSSVVDNYQYIFPLNQHQVNFVLNESEQPAKEKLLEIGCAKGSLSDELAKHYKSVNAIDLNAEMIDYAQKFGNKNVQYQALNMLKLSSVFGKEKFDKIVCFGNTLVHLNDINEMIEFFKQVKEKLADNGKFLLQIINYDRILNQNIEGLPTIDNEQINFERKYVYKPLSNKISFDTRLMVKATNEEIKNSIDLFPLREEELKAALKKAGFTKITTYGNFKKDELTNTSMPLIAIAQ